MELEPARFEAGNAVSCLPDPDNIPQVLVRGTTRDLLHNHRDELLIKHLIRASKTLDFLHYVTEVTTPRAWRYSDYVSPPGGRHCIYFAEPFLINNGTLEYLWNIVHFAFARSQTTVTLQTALKP